MQGRATSLRTDSPRGSSPVLPARPGPATAPVSPYPLRFEVKARSRPSGQTHPRHWIAEFCPAIKPLWGDTTMLQKRSVSIDELHHILQRTDDVTA